MEEAKEEVEDNIYLAEADLIQATSDQAGTPSASSKIGNDEATSEIFQDAQGTPQLRRSKRARKQTDEWWKETSLFRKLFPLKTSPGTTKLLQRRKIFTLGNLEWRKSTNAWRETAPGLSSTTNQAWKFCPTSTVQSQRNGFYSSNFDQCNHIWFRATSNSIAQGGVGLNPVYSNFWNYKNLCCAGDLGVGNLLWWFRTYCINFYLHIILWKGMLTISRCYVVMKNAASTERSQRSWALGVPSPSVFQSTLYSRALCIPTHSVFQRTL